MVKERAGQQAEWVDLRDKRILDSIPDLSAPFLLQMYSNKITGIGPRRSVGDQVIGDQVRRPTGR